MTNELVVDVQPKEVTIALLEDKSLVELQSEGRNISFSVGNMYLGRIRKLMPGLNACFVDVGYEKDAFLHYQDLGPQFNSLEKYVKQTLSDKKKLNPISKATILPDLEKDGTVSNTLKVGQEVVVQIVKEPISTKGPRLTSELSFAGRYLVLIPFNDKVSVSQKIKSSEERARLKQLLMSIKPKNFGVIVRTVAEGKRVAELDGELKVLVKHWEDAVVKIQKATKFPTLIYEETSRAVGLLRDLFNPSFESIHVNNEAVFHEIKDYVTLIAPERADIVKLYKGKLPIFDNFGITKQIKSSFGRTVSYKSGAYLIIEHTEALHVVDVNSGNRTKNANGQEARHEPGRKPPEAVRTYVPEHAERQGKTQHPAVEQIRADADHPPTRTPGHGRQYGGNLSHLLWKGNHQTFHPFHRYAGEQNRLPGKQVEDKEILTTHPPVYRRLRQPGHHVPEAQMANEIRIRHQDYSQPETRVSAICLLRHSWRRDRHEGRNRNQMMKAAEHV